MMTSKERAALKSQAAKIEPVLQIGKSGITPELAEAVRETFHTRELTKIHILQSCTEDGRMLASTLAERTGSQVVQVIGRMIVLYRKNDELSQKNATAPAVSKTTAKTAQVTMSKNTSKKNVPATMSKNSPKKNAMAAMSKSTSKKNTMAAMSKNSSKKNTMAAMSKSSPKRNTMAAFSKNAGKKNAASFAQKNSYRKSQNKI